MFYKYFQSYDDYFWQWEDNTEVIAIPNENTIAYTKQIVELIPFLAPNGLPPFGSLLLAIVATNPNGKASIDTIYALLQNTLKTTDDRCLSNAIEFLKIVSDLPEQYKSGKKRILLFQTLFNDCHNKYSIKNSHSISEDVNKNKFESLYQKKKEFTKSECEKEFRVIELLRNKFSDVNDIINKLARLVEFNEEELILNESAAQSETKEFTEQLIDNPKTFHVGSLIKRIWSGLNIPVHSALPSQQPIGGVSDLTNKGDFDKLLISEYANDDLVFLSRLANNEALFIRREIPPATNNLERIILIDISLKNWGTPKTIAFSTLLAIAKHPKTKIACSAYVIGNSYQLVTFENINDIIDSLELLDGSLNAANGITSFFQEYKNDKNKEIFLITEASATKQPAMAKAMADYNANIIYWIFTNSEGDLDVYKKQQNSKKHLQHIKLPLTELWKKESKLSRSIIDKNELKNKYPILLRNTGGTKKIIVTNEGEIFQVTNEKALLRFFDKSLKPYEKGWELIFENLPFHHGEYEIGLLDNGEYVLLLFNTHNRQITLLNLLSKETKYVSFNQWKSTSHQHFIFHNQKFYHFNYTGVWSIDLNGLLEKDSEVDVKLFEQKTKELKEKTTAHSQFMSAFKNVKEVYLNHDNNLMFNKHELTINRGKHIKIDKLEHITKKIVAEKTTDNEFVFHDGSTVRINRLGIFELRSSNTSLSTIYVPAFLNCSLGVATDECFSGNEYYLLEPQYEVILEDISASALTIVKLIKSLTEKGLAESKMIVDTAPSQICNYVSKIKAEQIKLKLEDNGAKVILNLHKNTIPFELEKIDSKQFFEKYITTFINNIIFYGTKN